MTLLTRLHFGQTYYPGRPYAPIITPANIPAATMMGAPDNTSPKEGAPGRPLHAHDYALAPIKAYKDERKDGRERREGMDLEARQGASMISEMNRHQIGEQLNTNAAMAPKPVNS